MGNTLTYKGLIARIDFSAKDGALVGRVAGINDEVTFHAETVPKLVKAFHQAVDGYIEACAKAGKKPEKAYSGQIAMRIDPAVHAQAARAAELAGKSLTQWTEQALRTAANYQVHPELQPAAPAGPTPKVDKVPRLKPATAISRLPKLASSKTPSLKETFAKHQAKKG